MYLMKYCDLNATKMVISVNPTKLLLVSKFTYKNVSKDQKLTNFKNLTFILKSNMMSFY